MKVMTRVWPLLLMFNTGFAAEYRIETVVDGLSWPWAMAFLPGGDLLVTERSGNLRRVVNGEPEPEPVANLPEIYVAGQGGLMDIVLDPDFETSHRLYLSYSAGTRGDNALKVLSARLVANGLQDIEIIFTASPGKDTPNHFGARMAFMPDDTLLVTVGEGFNFREKAQTLDNHFGKVVRIHTDGSVPEDNPFLGRENALPEIWTYGHRNPQGLLVSANGTVWLHEHGPRGGDELNLISSGKNYGWPAITYGMDYSGAYVSPYTEAEGMEQPVVYWVPSIAPSGFCEYQGDIFPKWRGDLFVSALVEKSVRRLVMDGGNVESQETLFAEPGERIREVKSGPDGYIYLLTDSPEGKILRVSPTE
jgi:glucose/arabinose dehydrogenase